MIQPLRILMCFSFLIYASYHDLKTRTVPNKIWPPMIAVGITLTVADIFLNKTNPFYWLTVFVIFVLAVSILVYILFELGAFGGADAKAIISLAVFVPEFVVGAFLNANLLLAAFLIPLLIIKKARGETWKSCMHYGTPFIPALTLGFIASVIYGNHFWLSIFEVIL